MNVAEFLKFQESEDGTNCKSQIRLWEHICMPLSEFLLLFNSSANFFVYMLFDKAFQKILRERFSTALNWCFCIKLLRSTQDDIPLSNRRQNTQETQDDSSQRSCGEGNETNCASNIDTVVTVEKCV